MFARGMHARSSEWKNDRPNASSKYRYLCLNEINKIFFFTMPTTTRSFYRGCDGRTKIFERNHCQIEKDERTCFTACEGDLCNRGNGGYIVIQDRSHPDVAGHLS